MNLYFISLLYIETADQPGLLVEIIKIIADINIDVESAEIDTEVSRCGNCISFSYSSVIASLFHSCNSFSVILTGVSSQRQISCQLQRGCIEQFLISGNSFNN